MDREFKRYILIDTSSDIYVGTFETIEDLTNYLNEAQYDDYTIDNFRGFDTFLNDEFSLSRSFNTNYVNASQATSVETIHPPGTKKCKNCDC